MVVVVLLLVDGGGGHLLIGRAVVVLVPLHCLPDPLFKSRLGLIPQQLFRFIDIGTCPRNVTCSGSSSGGSSSRGGGGGRRK